MKLYPLINASHQNTPEFLHHHPEIDENVEKWKKGRQMFWVCPFIWVRTTRKSVQWFLCNPADKPANQQTDMDENITSLAVQFGFNHK